MPPHNFQPGSEVRVKSDPGRRGVITNAEPRQQADYFKYRVRFPESTVWVPEHELELVDSDQSDPLMLLQAGRYGRPDDLRRTLTHIQLSGRLANLVYSMDATNTDFYAYQYKPVLSLLESPANGLLIADEVGLGKTIEAGLIWTELRARYDARRLVVICPAMLRDKWKTELRERFGVEAEFCNASELLRVLKTDKHKTPDRKGYICSLQGLRPPRGWADPKEPTQGPQADLARFLQDMEAEEDLIDLAIIDEAHYLRNPESQTARLGSLISEVSDHLVLLSATPINLHSEDLFHLLKLVDPDTFDSESMFPQVLEANAPIQSAHRLALDTRSTVEQIQEALQQADNHEVVRNSSQLRQLLGSGIAEANLDEAGRIELADAIGRINLLSHVVTRTRRVDVTELRVLRDARAEFIDLEEGGPERHFYDLVTQSIRAYAEEQGIGTGFLLATPQRQVSSSMYAAARAWEGNDQLDQEQAYEDFGWINEGISNGQDIDFAPLISHLRQTVLPEIDVDELRRVDTKYTRLKSVLHDLIRDNPDEKIIIFSYFRGCVDYLLERLTEDGISVLALKGGQKQSKQDVIDSFRTDPDIQVLVSTEVASEGVDLQFCRFLVNYDLPWNPMRVEQRIGRLDRIGQKAERIQIWNLFHRDTIDERIYTRLLERLHVFERALGGMEAVLGDKISRLTADLISRPLSPDEERERIEQTAMAVERIRRDQDELEQQASHLIAHSSYILRQVQAAHEFKRRITSEDLVNYTRDYLERFCPGHTFQGAADNPLQFDIKLPPDAVARLETFLRANNLLGQTRLATGELVSCLFKNKVRLPGEKREVISQFHPLIRFIASEITASDEQFYPLTAFIVARDLVDVSPGYYAFAVDLWSFDGLRTEEMLKVSVVNLDDLLPVGSNSAWELVNTGRLNGQPWHSAAMDIDTDIVMKAIEEAEEELQKAYRKEAEKRLSENADRITFQRHSATRHRDRLLKMNEEILSGHRAAGRSSLVRALEGKIRKVNERFDLRIAQLEERAKLTHSRIQTCMGVISVD